MDRKLGKLTPKNDPRTLKLSRYLRELPEIPTSVDYISNVKAWPMFANNKYGNCTCAAAGHMIQRWHKYGQGVDYTPSELEIVSAYSNVTGFDPRFPSTDRGANEHDVLKFWRKKGIAGHQIGAWVDVDPRNIEEVKLAIYWFGGLYIGVGLPNTAKDQEVWDTLDGPDAARYSWGGHAVDAGKYDDRYFWVITWGEVKQLTVNFWMTYVDEVHAILTKDWLNPETRKSPPGLDIDQLTEDLRLVTL